MGITDHVTNLRKKPDHHKKRIALAYSGAVTGVIFVIWLSVLLPRSYERTMGTSNQEASAFAATAEMKKQFGDLEQQFNDVKNQFPTAIDGQAGASAGLETSASSTAEDPGSGRQYDFGY